MQETWQLDYKCTLLFRPFYQSVLIFVDEGQRIWNCSGSRSRKFNTAQKKQWNINGMAPLVELLLQGFTGLYEFFCTLFPLSVILF